MASQDIGPEGRFLPFLLSGSAVTMDGREMAAGSAPQMGLGSAMARCSGQWTVDVVSCTPVCDPGDERLSYRLGCVSRLREFTSSRATWMRKGLLSLTRRGRTGSQLDSVLQSTADALSNPDPDPDPQQPSPGALRRRRLSVRRTLLIYQR